jgi:biopolymer transport protein ExbB
MIPIVACSLVALAFALERLWAIRSAMILPPDFAERLDAALARNNGDARDLCGRESHAAARIAAEGLAVWDRAPDAVRQSLADAGAREAHRMRSRLRVLSMVVALAPLLGLLGTIFGMITAFRTVAENAAALGRTELLAGGIYTAMVTTAAGLLVAIPVLVLHHALSALIDRRVVALDGFCTALARRSPLGRVPAAPSVEPKPLASTDAQTAAPVAAAA